MCLTKGFSYLVLGGISPTRLGRTLTHEHLSMTFDVAYVEPKDSEKSKTLLPFSMENLGWIKYNPYSHRLNLQMNGEDCEEAVESEMKRFLAAGGNSIVECTTHGISRNGSFLRKVSEITGVNIIAGTGYYVAASQRDAVLNKPIEELMCAMRDEILHGCLEAPNVKCGLIGEIGCSYPLHGNAFYAVVVQC